MVGRVRSVLTRPQSSARHDSAPGRWLLLAGLAVFGVALGGYVIYMVGHAKAYTMDPVDLAVYRSGGLIVRHIRPYYDPHLAAPLYDWAGYGNLHLPFTYPPFSAVAFALISFVPYQLSLKLSVAVDLVALLAAVWFTLGGLGYRRLTVRAGATLLAAGAVLWTEPVLRTIYLGQVNLVLLALIMWDLCQPDTDKSRWWKGFGTGIAAGIKLVPLIFIPYLLVARKFRQAAMTLAGFVFTVLAGFVFLPADSAKWWFGGLFAQSNRTGFPGWAGDQSLDGLITRLAGSIHGGRPAWIAAVVVFGAAGVICAGLLDRKGQPMLGLLMAALTGLLISPISWDHHWVWIVPGVVVAGHYAAAGVAPGRQEDGGGLRAAGRGHPGLVRRLADQVLPRHPAQPRPGLTRPAVDPEEHQPHLVPVVRRSALVPGVPLARVGSALGQRLHPGRAGPLRGAAGRLAAAARGRERSRRPARARSGRPAWPAAPARGLRISRTGPAGFPTALARRPSPRALT